MWKSGAVPKEWQTGVVVPLFKTGDQRVCANYVNYTGITLLSLPGKVYSKAGVGNPVPSEPQGVLLFVFALRSATNSDPRTR